MIFESLNDKGMQLTASELLCNYLFTPIIKAKENYEDAFTTPNGSGRFGCWMTMTDSRNTCGIYSPLAKPKWWVSTASLRAFQGKRIKSEALIPHHQGSGSPSIFSGAPLYRTIGYPISFPIKRTKVSISFSSQLGIHGWGSSTPFVLSVLRAHAAETLTDEQSRAILRETLVLLVRAKDQPNWQLRNTTNVSSIAWMDYK